MTFSLLETYCESPKRAGLGEDRLATSDEPITSIALDCGLENLGHFYRLFHARYGSTPRGYRLRQRAVVDPSHRARRR